MVNFRFIHAADLHLDSPLIGLAKKSEDCAARLDDASLRAFDNLVALAIEEDCRLIVIAGDIFDGQWRDYRTGLFFANRMLRLSQAGIRVIIIAGNHDAENRFANRLEYSDNVKLLSTRLPESVAIDELGAVIHGRSFPFQVRFRAASTSACCTRPVAEARGIPAMRPARSRSSSIMAINIGPWVMFIRAKN
jgi:DNA repair protein SbcD/Mre11